MTGLSLMLLLAASPASATPLAIEGSTAGCFGAGCDSFASSVSSGSPYSLTFIGVDPFTTVTDGSGSATGILLGSFERGNVNVPGSTPALPFTLAVTFAAPIGVSGGPDYVTAFITGTSPGGGGPLDVIFDNAWQLVTFSSPGGFGSFEFSVPSNPEVQKNSSVNLYGAIRNASYTTELEQVPPPIATPEPASLLLLGTGLAAVARGVRRRRAPRA